MHVLVASGSVPADAVLVSKHAALVGVSQLYCHAELKGFKRSHLTLLLPLVTPHCCWCGFVGSWCEWKEKHVQLRHCSSSGSYPGDWVALFKMKTGQHEYKFNVDGAWRVAPADPLVMDPEVRANGEEATGQRACTSSSRWRRSSPALSQLTQAVSCSELLTAVWLAAGMVSSSMGPVPEQRLLQQQVQGC
jgi:hypothetical protein